MTRVDGWRTTLQQWMLVPVAMLAIVACKRDDTRVGTLTIATIADRGAILAEATTNYTYGPDREPVTVDTTYIRAPGGTLPTIKIATATQTNAAGRVPGNRFSFRLTSNAAYAPLGLAPGLNYVWRDTSAGPEGPYRLLVVPADTAYPMKWLKRDSSTTAYVAETASEPRLVKSAKGYGGCDPNCSPHCVSKTFLRSYSASDTLRIINP